MSYLDTLYLNMSEVDIMLPIISMFIIGIYNFKLLNAPHKYISTIFISLLCALESYLYNYFYFNTSLLMFFQIFTIIIINMLTLKKWNIKYCIIPTLLLILQTFVNTISLVIISLFTSIAPYYIREQGSTYILAMFILSTVLFILLMHLFFKYHSKIKIQINNIDNTPYWYSFSIFAFAFLNAFSILYEFIYYHYYRTIKIYSLLFLFMIVFISFIIFFFNMQREYQNHLMISTELIKKQYLEKNFKEINKLSYQISQDKHDMFYILKSIQNLANKNDTKSINQLIDKNLYKYQTPSLTLTNKNVYFDYLILNYIHDLKKSGYNIKTIIQNNDNRLLKEREVLTIIRDCIDIFVQYTIQTKHFDIQLYEHQSYLTLKLTTTINNQSIVIPKYKQSFIKRIKLNETDNQIELIVLFKEDD